MNQQEMNQLEAEIRARFPSLKINCGMSVRGDVETRTFIEEGSIAVWYGNECVCVLNSRASFDALVAVAHIIVDSDLTSE